MTLFADKQYSCSLLSPRVLVTALLALSLVVAGAATLRAQSGSSNAAKPQQAVGVKAGSYGSVSVTGIQTLSNGVIMTTKEGTTLRTNLVQYNTKTYIATAPDKIQIDDERNTLTGNSGKAFYQKREAVIDGSVKIVVRPKPGSASAPEGSVRSEFKDPVMIFCDHVTYDWRNRIAVATGNLTLKQNTSDGTRRTATAKKLIYYTREERLILDGDVNAVDSKGQKLKGPQAVAIIREGAEEFRMEKGADAVILIPDEDEPDNSATPLAPPPPPDTAPVPPANTPGSAPKPVQPLVPTTPTTTVPTTTPKVTPLP